MKPFAKDHSLRHALYAVSLLGVLSAPLSAAAQQPQPTASQAQYRKAYKAMEQGQWSDAKSLLLDLWNKAQTYDVAESLSHVEFHAGNYAPRANVT
jgi:predicted Zn-dependent protease